MARGSSTVVLLADAAFRSLEGVELPGALVTGER
jgi:hypothetical protein